jgi:uncharacterized protein involved in exopolysaccharide biosynthesis
MATEAYRPGEPDIEPARPQESELVRLLNALLRNRRLVIGMPAAVALAVFVLMLLQPRLYRSEAAFVPQQTQRMPTAVAGLAAQFGIPLQGDRLDQSPAFYADLLLSREILQNVVWKEYDASLHGGDRPLTLIELYEIDDDDSAVRVQRAVARLRSSLRPGRDAETGVVTFSVPARTPALAEAVAQEIIEQINQFNLRRRQSVAEAEREFVADRLEAASAELATAEANLQRFDERNLRIDNSPELRLERDRLQRLVGMRQEVVTMLMQAHEQARIDEVRNTPAITIIERPSRPVRPDARGTIKRTIATFIIFAFLGTMLASGRELLARMRAGQGRAHQEFRELEGRLRPRWLGRRGQG